MMIWQYRVEDLTAIYNDSRAIERRVNAVCAEPEGWHILAVDNDKQYLRIWFARQIPKPGTDLGKGF
jgi:hypothetical protein